MEKHIHYEVQDFAHDDSFIHWVNETNVQDMSYWEQWIMAHPDKHDEIAQAKRLVQGMIFKHDNSTATIEDKLWDNISNATKGLEAIKPSGKSIFRIIMPLAAAAVIALLVFFNIGTTKDFDTVIKTELAEISAEDLPDGSKIYINADSKITYDKATWQDERIVSLEGEAFFEVAKGSKFLVRTPDGDVSVLGTSFNVYSRTDELKVICQTGKVAVNAHGKETILTPKESVAVINGKHRMTTENNIDLNRSNWRNASYAYRSQQFGHVVEDVQRQFNVSIDIDKTLAQKLYTGQLRMHNLDSVLYQMCWPLDYKYEISNQKITITK